MYDSIKHEQQAYSRNWQTLTNLMYVHFQAQKDVNYSTSSVIVVLIVSFKILLTKRKYHCIEHSNQACDSTTKYCENKNNEYPKTLRNIYKTTVIYIYVIPICSISCTANAVSNSLSHTGPFYFKPTEVTDCQCCFRKSHSGTLDRFINPTRVTEVELWTLAVLCLILWKLSSLRSKILNSP